MNNDVHFLSSGGAGLANCAFRNKQNGRKIDFWEGLSVFLAAGLAGTLPDMIDPATNPNHRSIGYSMILSGAGIPKLWNHIEHSPNLNVQQKIFWQSIILRFGMHLALDSTTPAGLPLLD